MAIRQRGNTYQVVYRCPGESSPRTETFKTEDEAIIRDMQIKLSKKNGTFTAPERISKSEIREVKNITVKDFLQEFIEEYGLKKWGNSYYSSNIGLMQNYINPYIGDRYVRSITVRDIDAYYSKLLDVKAVLPMGHKDTGEKVSASTVARIHKLLKTAFGKAVVWDYIKVNPTLGATLPQQRQVERAVWSNSEALHAISICEHPMLKLCLYLALGCSMRLGEILGLQWSNIFISDEDIGLGTAHLKVDKELQRCSNKSIEALEKVNRSTIILKFPTVMPKKASTTLVLKLPKTDSSIRTIYLPLAVIQELKKAKTKQEEYKSIFGEEYKDYDLVIAQVNGRPFEIRTIDKWFYDLVEKNSLRPVVFHSLRHSSTSLKLKLSQGNIKAVQGDTGHAEARMVTDTYAHSFDEDRRLIAKEMDSGFFSKVGNETNRQGISDDMLAQLKLLVAEHPELVKELLAK